MMPGPDSTNRSMARRLSFAAGTDSMNEVPSHPG